MDNEPFVIRGDAEAAAFLRVSRSTVIALKHKTHDPLPHYKNGRTTMYDRESLKEWQKRQYTRIKEV